MNVRKNPSSPEARQFSLLPIPEVLEAGDLATAESNPIIVANAAMMQGDLFAQIAEEESVGGNAGIAEINGQVYLCVGVNGYCNTQTGEIATFGNVEDVDPEVLNQKGRFIFRIAVRSLARPDGDCKIFVDLAHWGEISPVGLDNLATSAAMVNQGFFS